jgi:hypothetical protein
MRAGILGCVLLVVGIETACSSPAVLYQAADDPQAPTSSDTQAVLKADQHAEATATTFVLPISKLEISVPYATQSTANQGAKKGVENPINNDATPAASGSTSQDIGNGFSASITPTESGRYYRVVPSNGISSTTIQVTKVANTDIPATVSVNFVSSAQRVASVVQTLGSVAVAAAGFASQVEACSKAGTPLAPFSIVLDTGAVGTIANPPMEQPVPNQPCWHYHISPETIASAPDAITIASFNNQISQNPDMALHFWPVPACRDVSLVITEENPKPGTNPKIITGIMRIIDPLYIRAVYLPQKGKITLHPVCDADVSDSPTDSYSDWTATAQKVFDTAKSVDQAINGSSNNGSKPSSSTNTTEKKAN